MPGLVGGQSMVCTVVVAATALRVGAVVVFSRDAGGAVSAWLGRGCEMRRRCYGCINGDSYKTGGNAPRGSPQMGVCPYVASRPPSSTDDRVWRIAASWYVG